jgi:hypothetical protein
LKNIGMEKPSPIKHTQRNRMILIQVLFFLLVFPSTVRTESVIQVGKFSEAKELNGIPQGWEPLTFRKIKNHTRYTLVVDQGIRVVKAVSNCSSSGLIRNISIHPAEYPIITWQWKITKILKKGDVTKKQGDDYPARIYVTFTYDPANLSFMEKTKYKTVRLLYGKYPPQGAINYIWDSKATQGTVVPNPYTERVMMIVVRSGEKMLNTWVREERNLYEDYKKAFGTEPSTISGVAIMTDTDNTRESAVTFYGDIIFKKQ